MPIVPVLKISHRLNTSWQVSVLFSLKRKLGSLFSYAKKKPHLDEEQPEDINPERQRHEYKRSEGESSSSSSSLGEKRGDTAQRTPTSLSWTHSPFSAQQTVKVSPLSRTVSRSVPPEGGDRDANMLRLIALEKEAERLRKLVDLEVKKISQSTMTESENSEGDQDGGLMKQSATTASRDVGCQTEEAEVGRI